MLSPSIGMVGLAAMPLPGAARRFPWRDQQPSLIDRYREKPGQCRAGNVRRGQPGRVRVCVHDRGRVEAADLARGIDLGTEPLAKVRIGGQLRARHLDGHGATTPGPCQIRRAHAARAELSLHGLRADTPRQIPHDLHAPYASRGREPGDRFKVLATPAGSSSSSEACTDVRPSPSCVGSHRRRCPGGAATSYADGDARRTTRCARRSALSAAEPHFCRGLCRPWPALTQTPHFNRLAAS